MKRKLELPLVNQSLAEQPTSSCQRQVIEKKYNSLWMSCLEGQ